MLSVHNVIYLSIDSSKSNLSISIYLALSLSLVLMFIRLQDEKTIELLSTRCTSLTELEFKWFPSLSNLAILSHLTKITSLHKLSLKYIHGITTNALLSWIHNSPSLEKVNIYIPITTPAIANHSVPVCNDIRYPILLPIGGTYWINKHKEIIS